MATRTKPRIPKRRPAPRRGRSPRSDQRRQIHAVFRKALDLIPGATSTDKACALEISTDFYLDLYFGRTPIERATLIRMAHLLAFRKAELASQACHASANLTDPWVPRGRMRNVMREMWLEDVRRFLQAPISYHRDDLDDLTPWARESALLRRERYARRERERAGSGGRAPCAEEVDRG
jgi:hypothetical protein